MSSQPRLTREHREMTEDLIAEIVDHRASVRSLMRSPHDVELEDLLSRIHGPYWSHRDVTATLRCFRRIFPDGKIA